MDKYNDINKAISYIEKNIKEGLTLLDISNSVNISPFYFHRLFSNLVGETVMSYVNRRKVTNSLEDLRITNRTVAQIAYDYGYESQSVYQRVFKRYFGVTPGKYRSGTNILENQERQLFCKAQLRKNVEGDYFMNRILIIEVGSTTTKTYVAYEDMRVDTLPLKYIPFKENYILGNGLRNKDIEELEQYILELKTKYNVDIKICGTSIFRNLLEEEKASFFNRLKRNTGLEFEIISQEDEAKYTAKGAAGNILGNISVLVTGGGSMELVRCQDGEILDINYMKFGVADIMKEFPALAENKTDVSLEKLVEYIEFNYKVPKAEDEILILAGGQHLMFADIANYDLTKNTFYKDINQRYIIDKKTAYKNDERFFNEESLSKYKKLTPDNENWWNGTRAARGCVEAIVKDMGVEYIVPTDISMIYGIVRDVYSCAQKGDK
ncbi:MAG: AraC family transcriptional regulator [Clostridia bacterium]|jgi:AraC-like DNA-binding protein|nr:AraC family transcriptional regulator [Clostridia bacterium]